MRKFLTLCATTLWLVPAVGHAGERPFLWAYDTTIVSTGNIELEQWLWATGDGDGYPGSPTAYWLWWSPVVGVTRHIELAVPFQILETHGTTSLDSIDADLRWRLFPQDDSGGVQALLRTSWHQVTSATASNPSRMDFNLSTSYGSLTEKHFVLELGGQLGLPGLAGLSGALPFTGTYDGGVAFPLKGGEFHVSLETFGKVVLSPASSFHPYAGGSMSWTSGRFWATLGMLVGISKAPSFMPRLIWAVSL